MTNNPFWECLENALPDVFPRKDVSKLTRGIVSSRSMANLDSLGVGPSMKVRLNGYVCYEKQDFLEWLKARANGEHKSAPAKSSILGKHYLGGRNESK